MHAALRAWRTLALAVMLPLATTAAEGAELSPDRAVALAIQAHPDRIAAEADIARARAARRASAVMLANPIVIGFLTPGLDHGELRAFQPVSLTGEGWHERARARHATQAAGHRRDRTLHRLAARVRAAYIEAVVAAGQVEVARDGLALAERLRDAVARKEQVGEASLLDLRLARLAETQAAVRLLEARRVEAEALRRLSAWTLVEVRAEELLPDPLQAAPDPSVAPAGDGARRSDLEAAEARVEALEAELRRARAAAMPLLDVGVGAEVESDRTHLGPAVRVRLPLFDRAQTERAAARTELDVARAEVEAVRAQIDTETATSLTRQTEADEALGSVAVSTLDEGRAALESIEAGVAAGEIDLPSALLLQAQVLEGQAAVVRLRGLVADARVDRLLALDDPALLGPGGAGPAD